VVRCSQCGLLYLSPRLKESAIVRIYEERGYYSPGGDFGYRSYVDQERSLMLTFRRFLRYLSKKKLSGGDLLEVGCGFGYLLEEARGFFGRRIGIDLSKEAVDKARSVSDGVHCGRIETLPESLGLFDTIIAVNLLEHLYDPLEFLKAAKRRLRRGGAMVIATPNAGSFWFYVMGRRWPSFKIPEHVTFFNFQSLNLLFLKAGYPKTITIPFPHAFPLSLVGKKLGIEVPSALGCLAIWLPKTMIAVAAMEDKSDEE
jgi:SAM-dependent methyltransferase